jgi:hypothetical protein
MPLPEGLFTGVQTDAGTDETLTTERTFVPFGPNGEPLGGVPPNMLDADGALPPGILIRRRHTIRCALQRPPASEAPVAVFEFENGCLLYVVKRVCFRTTHVFFVFGLTEYGIGTTHVRESETDMAVRVCPDRFDVMGPLADVAGDPARPPPPLGDKGDDYVWIPPRTGPVGVQHAHFKPGPPAGTEGGRLWNDEYVWHMVPPARRRRCRIVTRYRMARVRRWVKPDGTLDGPPETLLLEPPVTFDFEKDIPGCR